MSGPPGAALAGALRRGDNQRLASIRRALDQVHDGRAHRKAILSSLLVKPIGDACNLRCTYCYEQTLAAPKTRMKREIIDAIADGLPDVAGRSISIAWHGGEPLLAGHDFLDWGMGRLAQAGENYGIVVEQALQTNGTLISNRWIELFRKYELQIGVSIDGPQDLHDEVRFGPSGNPSWEKVVKGVGRLVDERIPVGIISVIRSGHAGRAAEHLHAIAASGVKNLDAHPDIGAQGLSVPAHVFTQFMCELFDAWVALDDGDFRIATFDDAIHWLVGGQPQLCYFAGACATIVGVESDGTVIPCTRPFSRDLWTFGDLSFSSLIEIAGGERFRAFAAADTVAQKRSQDCKWSGLCNQGCPQHRTADGRVGVVDGENILCTCSRNQPGGPGHAELFEHIAQYVSSYREIEVPLATSSAPIRLTPMVAR